MARNNDADTADEREAPPERRENLWVLTFAPLIWSVHFVLSYATAAVWCAKFVGRSGPLDNARIAVGIYTLIALFGIGLTFWAGFRRSTFGQATAPHDFDTAADRHRFLGFATLLLSSLSFVATVYVALAILFIRSCA